MSKQQMAAAVAFGIFLLYADPKFGKTAAFLRAFPTGLYIGRRDAIQPVAESVCGFTPEPWQIVENITTLPELIWWLTDDKVGLRSPGWQSYIQAGIVNAIYIDDLSQMASKSVILWEAEAGNDRFYGWKKLDRALDHVAVLLADLGLMCGVSMHKVDPKFDTRDKSPTKGMLLSMGAPEVPSSKQIQAVPGWATLVAPVRAGASGDPWWGRVICVDSSEAGLWVSGDRNSVCWSETPLNLREILRASSMPYRFTRRPGLEWQEDYAHAVADALDRGEQLLAIAERVFPIFGAYANPGMPGERHVQWAIQDGIAMHRIRKHRKGGVLSVLRGSAAFAPPPPAPPEAGKPETPAPK